MRNMFSIPSNYPINIRAESFDSFDKQISGFTHRGLLERHMPNSRSYAFPYSAQIVKTNFNQSNSKSALPTL